MMIDSERVQLALRLHRVEFDIQ